MTGRTRALPGIDFIDTAQCRARAQIFFKGLQFIFTALCFGFDIAIRPVFHPAGNFQRPRFFSGELAETNTLHTA